MIGLSANSRRILISRTGFSIGVHSIGMTFTATLDGNGSAAPEAALGPSTWQHYTRPKEHSPISRIGTNVAFAGTAIGAAAFAGTAPAAFAGTAQEASASHMCETLVVGATISDGCAPEASSVRSPWPRRPPRQKLLIACCAWVFQESGCITCKLMIISRASSRLQIATQ